MNRQYKAIAALVMLVQSIFAQTPNDNLWSNINETAIRVTGKRQIVPSKYFTSRVDAGKLRAALFSAPHEKLVNINQSPCVISLIGPNGNSIPVRVVESPIMADALSTAYPGIKTFSFRGLNDKRITGKLDWSELGFHAMVFSPRGDFFIDPYCVGNTTDYIAYFTADFQKRPEDRHPEGGVIRTEADPSKKKNELPTPPLQRAPPAVCVGSNLKTYRLAVACTGEYAVAATGFSAPTVAQTLAKVVTSVNRVNGVYETELAVRLVLVQNDTLVLYTDANTDPFTGNANSNPSTLIGLSQSVITSSIGSANFDIGHTFSTGAGGLAFFGCVCVNSSKANGVTGSSNPVGDPYDIDYVAHEIGHQFGGDHSFNATSSGCFGNRNASTSVEPGSGITIMGYAGLCGAQDLSNHSIPYFHAISYDQIVSFVNGFASCAVTTTTGNQPPVITGAGTFYIPKGTPFYLTGSGTDPDGDSLVYSWEEIDTGTSGGNWNSGSKPFFRTYAPDTSPTRYFPNKNVVLSGNYQATKGEYLPTTPQVLNFRLTGRDKNPTGGGVCYDMAQVVMDTTGPFFVIYPSASGISWVSGTQQNILWDTKYTNVPPISCDSVRILISYDAGNSYSVLVKSAVNWGIYQLTAPVVSNTITTCRIKVEALNNVFYDISDNNFTILPVNTVLLEEFSEYNPFGLSVWPNPVTTSFQILATNLNARFLTSLSVKDVLGKVVYSQDFESKDRLMEFVDMSSFEAGLYFVSVYNNGHQSVYRVVRQ